MRGKLTLKVDELSVDSFDTTGGRQVQGTVMGEQCTCYTRCQTCPGSPTCGTGTCVTGPSEDSCEQTCGGTCGYSCAYSCMCNSQQPCPTALYTACNGYDCL